MKKKKSLTFRQKKYIKAIASGVAKTKSEAAEIAGYSRTTITNQIERPEIVKNALATAMYKVGVDERYLADKIKEGLNADQTKFFAYEGKIISERTVIDYDVREKYLKDSLEVLGFIRNNTIDNLNIGLIQLPTNQNDDEWEANQSQVKEQDNIQSKDILSSAISQ